MNIMYETRYSITLLIQLDDSCAHILGLSEVAPASLKCPLIHVAFFYCRVFATLNLFSLCAQITLWHEKFRNLHIPSGCCSYLNKFAHVSADSIEETGLLFRRA